MTAAAPDARAALAAAARAAGALALIVAGAVALAFAAAAALVIALVVAGAAIALRFAPRAASPAGDVLEARETPAGWVVETLTRRPS